MARGSNDLDVTGRAARLREVDLQRFFRPSSVLVLGASDTAGKPTSAMTRKITEWAARWGAAVHYVNPNRDTVNGHPCHRSVDEVPGDVDLAVILTGDAIEGFRAVLPKSPRFAVIFAAGFAEVGDEGGAKQAELAALVAASDTHLLGPNTNLNAFEIFDDALDGARLALDHAVRPPRSPHLPGPGARHRDGLLGAHRQRG